MKKLTLVFLLVLLVLLCSCGSGSSVYEVDYGGRVYSVNWEEMTIAVEDVVCRFEFSGSVENHRFDVTYSDGSSWFTNKSENTTSSGWSDDYSAPNYISGDTLCYIVLNTLKTKEPVVSGAGLVAGIVIIAIGVLEVACPRLGWHLGYGWRFKNTEPSDAALVMGRVGGVIAILVGVVCIFVL